ncbi:MAG: hypothetical protein DMG60_20585 [Acidobacteria bacterium]|nr:MAG: hypothetical protein DMG60_20585 [Acidobacteriota bacterium]
MTHPHNEAGRRLFAAVLSSQMGITVDYCLARYVPAVVDPSWADLAWKLQQQIVDQYYRDVMNPDQGTRRTQ